MGRSIRTLMIVLSVGLNIAFVAVWAIHRLPTGCRHGGERGVRMGGAACPWHERIEATSAQRAAIEARMDAFRAASAPLCAEVNRHRLELIELLSAVEPDRAAIQAKQSEILNGQSQMQARVIANLLDMKKDITPEQQAVFFKFIRERSGCAGHGPMMMNAGTNPPCRH